MTSITNRTLPALLTAAALLMPAAAWAQTAGQSPAPPV